MIEVYLCIAQLEHAEATCKDSLVKSSASASAKDDKLVTDASSSDAAEKTAPSDAEGGKDKDQLAPDQRAAASSQSSEVEEISIAFDSLVTTRKIRSGSSFHSVGIDLKSASSYQSMYTDSTIPGGISSTEVAEESVEARTSRCACAFILVEMS
jgi:hypothetical protein